MTNSHLTDIQRENWNAVATDWSRQFDWYAAAFRPFVDWCCDAIHLAPQQRVLDIASGTGVPSLAIATRMHNVGTVVATDISSEMLLGLKQRANELRISKWYATHPSTRTSKPRKRSRRD